MSLRLYKRGRYYWIMGRIDEIPKGKFYRQSLKKTELAHAQTAMREFINEEVQRHFAGDNHCITFSEAIAHYRANPETARDLLKLIDHIGHKRLDEITPTYVLRLGRKIYPNSSTDSWHRHVITPIRSVMKEAHKLGLGPAVEFSTYTKAERQAQDKLRGKQSRVELTPSDWTWIHSFRNAASPKLAALALFMFVTGARIGQATAISFDDFDPQTGMVLMPPSKLTPAQWEKLPQELVEELKLLHAKRNKPRKTKRGKIIKPKKGHDRLFGYSGRCSVYKTWKRVCKKAKIQIIMPHAAGRHGFATELLVRQGLDAPTVAKKGRWADANLVLNRYAHAENVDERVDNAFRTGLVQANKNFTSKPLKTKDKSKND